VLVLGDVILDEYVYGRATRMSREAPIPVLEFQQRRYIPGGAANPASNIVALGGTATQIGVIGDDEAGQHLTIALGQHGINTTGLLTCTDRPTTLKTRIMAQMGLRFPQQVARVDTLTRQPIDANTEAQVIERLDACISGRSVDTVLVSDYQAGLLTPSLVKAVENRLFGNAFLAADAQGALEKYRRFDLVKCNADDASTYLRRDLNTDADFAAAARALQQQLGIMGAMVITRGADGATVAEANGPVAHCPAPLVSDVYDTVGAGDTAIAVMTLAIVAGAGYVDAVRLANVASGIVVRHVGNYTPSPAELLAALDANA
jgi:D-glycero-beta-D-manno-heptose-7-phosphate kinase